MAQSVQNKMRSIMYLLILIIFVGSLASTLGLAIQNLTGSGLLGAVVAGVLGLLVIAGIVFFAMDGILGGGRGK